MDVVYAKVSPSDGSDKLQALSDALVDIFVSEGIISRQYDRVKLHLTLMNTLFRKEDTGGIADNEVGSSKRDRRPPRESLDARKILEIFGERKFCTLPLTEVHLSQRRSKKTEEGYYWPTAVMKV